MNKSKIEILPNLKKLHIISYGCQMNTVDSEVVVSILSKEGYRLVEDYKNADIILLNTCSVREKAEQTIREKLRQFGHLRKKRPHLIVGILGCMAERLKEKLLEEEKVVDLVCGPDAYRALPELVEFALDKQKAVNVQLSLEETYDDISPVRLSSNGVSAFVSVTRGCDNMCSYCVVPFTRGRERSRDPETIFSEIEELQIRNYKEVTLLGQNIDSYLWFGGGAKKDFSKKSTEIQNSAVNFAKLLKMTAEKFPNIRIRFCTSNPHDMTDEALEVIAKYDNIAKYIHLPFQSGSDSILKSMKRGYTVEEYLNLIEKIKNKIPDCSLTTDIIAGYPGESEEDHKATLSLMEKVKYDYAYMFAYSERPGTYAAKFLEDNIPEDVKKARLEQIIKLQGSHSKERNASYVGRISKVLVEGVSKKDENMFFGRNSQNTVVVFPKENFNSGDFVDVKIERATQGTLIGRAIL